jgi:hypothetical protein
LFTNRAIYILIIQIHIPTGRDARSSPGMQFLSPSVNLNITKIKKSKFTHVTGERKKQNWEERIES